jgi:hypothetical protein
MRLKIPFTGPTYESDSVFLSNQVCRNFYLRPYPEMGQEAMALFGTPGLVEWCDLGVTGEVRGLLAFDHYLYAVAGRKLFRLTSAGVSEELGELGTTEGIVGMATNGLDLIIVDGSSGYVWDYATEIFAEITDADFPRAQSVIHIDGYYLVPKRGTGQIWRSDFNDGTSWGGLAFDSAGANPDDVLALQVSNRDVYTIGERTTQIWVNTGAAVFNFQSIQGSFIEKGTPSPFASCVGNNAVYFVSRDDKGQGEVVQVTSRLAKVVSTSAITRHIQSWGDLGDVQLFSYEQKGHTHIVVTSPQANETLVFDSTTGQWHERSSRFLLGTEMVDGRWRANAHAFFANGNRHVVGDKGNGKLYTLDPDAYDEDGEEMISVRRTQVFRSNQDRLTIHELQIVTEPGVGLVTGEAQDVDPQGILRWSKDGGRHWSAGVDVSLGSIGETENRARVIQLGQGENWVFELTISARVKRVVKDAIAEVTRDE